MLIMTIILKIIVVITFKIVDCNINYGKTTVYYSNNL